ncbi:MAG TPA: hypothetical protein VN944_00355 [Nitrospiria bacterium]|nr:hypothetical protein [Nitrospiria bacterium]
MKKPILFSLFFLMLFLPFLGGCEAKRLKEENQKLKAQFEQMKAESKGMTDSLEQYRKENEQAVQKVTALQEDNNRLKADLEESKKKECKAKKTEIKKKKKKKSSR